MKKSIAALGIERQAGQPAKVYLIAWKARCPETGWMVPMSPSWVISKNGNVIAAAPDYANKCFDVQVANGASAAG